MAEKPEHEPQHWLGMPVEPGHIRPLVDPTENRVLGVPLSWYRHKPIDLSGWRHPIRWIRWRMSHHRGGPYAPDFKEFSTRQ